MQIFIRNLTGNTKTIDCSPHETVLEIKKKLEEKERIQLEYQLLIYAGKLLIDDKTLSDYSINQDTTINLAQRLPGGGGPFLNLNLVDMKDKLWKGFSSEAPR